MRAYAQSRQYQTIVESRVYLSNRLMLEFLGLGLALGLACNAMEVPTNSTIYHTDWNQQRRRQYFKHMTFKEQQLLWTCYLSSYWLWNIWNFTYFLLFQPFSILNFLYFFWRYKFVKWRIVKLWCLDKILCLKNGALLSEIESLTIEVDNIVLLWRVLRCSWHY